MKTPFRFLAMLFGSLLLVAGGEQAHASAFGPPSADSVKIDLSANSITTNTTATLTVTVTRRNGAPEADGKVLSATVSPPTLGSIAGSGSSGVASSSSVLSGGVATFVFIANNTPGTATVTVSLPPANGHPNTVTTKVTIAVTQGDGNNPNLKATPSTVTLPQNLVGAGPYFGSPYMAEVDVEWRGLITGQLLNGKIAVSTNPVNSIAFSTLDDPTTPWVGATKTPPTAEGNEFLTELGSGTVNVTAGVGTIFVHSQANTGPATLTITAVDPETNRTISSQIVVNVVTPPGANLPTTVTLSQGAGGVYVKDSNGPQSKLVTATVNNIYGTPAIAAPGIDNVQFDIVGPSGSDAQLFGISAGGVPQTGASVKTSTGAGGASVYLLAGNKQGPVQIRATVDAYDGDVGNGVTIPLTATTTVAVSDGRLYSLTITSPIVNAIAVNGISASSSSSGGSGTGPTIPLQPDATYSLTVSAIGTDRQGNPVLPGTEIKFGLIDGPQDPNFTATCSGLGAFQICGAQGNPQPGGIYFSSPDGRFKTTGGGGGPGDTLIVFGKQAHGAPAGNDDLESALPITGIASDTQLFTLFPFNRNDTTGTSMLPGPLPYVIGRATIGNINSPAKTDSSGAATVTGTATTKLNYPVSRLGRSVAIWAQGTGPDTAYLDANGNPTTRLVTDAIVTVYPAVADLSVSASPNPITGNITVPMTVCVVDALRVPIPGMRFNFSFSNLGAGSGTVDGIDTTGWTHDATDSTGCVVATVTTQGIASSGGSGGSSGTPTLTFVAAGYAAGSSASVAIPINAGGNLVLLASPSSLGGTGGNVSLTLLSSNGKPVPGAQLTGTCTGDTVSLDSGPGTTDSNGRTSASISANLNNYGSAGSGSCTFATASGSPTATVNLKGVNLCLTDPTNAACTSGGTGGGSGNGLTIIVTTGPSTSNASVSVAGVPQFSPPPTCSVSAVSSTKTCTYTIPTTVTQVTLSSNPGTGTWSGDCGSGSAGSPYVLAIGGAAKTCTATFP
ncbi:hypothetical protein [Rudaea sp.]|uniref:hypothetical protein n=1 Tax=Rudaea sp. TaxID=2136325 RepID=UPI003784873A